MTQDINKAERAATQEHGAANCSSSAAAYCASFPSGAADEKGAGDDEEGAGDELYDVELGGFAEKDGADCQRHQHVAAPDRGEFRDGDTISEKRKADEAGADGKAGA